MDAAYFDAARRLGDDMSSETLGLVLLGILTFLVVATIFFERTQEWMIEVSVPTMKPVVRQTFAEITVLGFLSIVTLVLEKVGFLDFLAIEIFGDDDESEETLEDLVEDAHYTLFLVMIVFIILVMAMVFMGNHLSRLWTSLDRYCVQLADKGCATPWAPGAPPVPEGVRRSMTMTEVVQYWGMRVEFLKDRAILPPHKESDANKQLAYNFPYGHYLLESLSEDLVEMVDVTWQTWVVLELLAVIFCVMVVLDDQPAWVTLIWVVFEYLLFAVSIVFLRHVRWIASMIMHPDAKDYDGLGMCGAGKGRAYSDDGTGRIVCAKDISSTGTEHTPMLSEELPGWAAAPHPGFEKRSKLAGHVFGHAPNKQHKLFLFEERGHESHIFACRLLLLLQAIYVSLLCMVILPDASDYTDTWGTAVVAVVGFLPFFGIVAVNEKAIPLAIHVGSVGTFRNRRLIAKVSRDQKAERAVKLLETLYSLKNQFAAIEVPDETDEAKEAPPGGAAARPSLPRGETLHDIMDNDEIAAIARTFDLYDTDGTGQLDPSELQKLMKSLGKELTEAQSNAMLKRLDTDGDGLVSRDEFLVWSANNQPTAATASSIEATAKAIFAMFDEDGSGSITYREFKDGLTRFGVEISDDELTILIEELDKDQSGDIGEEEFTHLLQQFTPEEE
ncbi:Calcium-binding protein [Aureococcus anophagefferens]|uniref:Calcium-binding protein n=2 Tax=Aureococcus anophagefferens TaxID=44056 RepID=A0ABR1FKI3_AURAN